MLEEESERNSSSLNTYYKDPNYDIYAAEIIGKEPFTCKSLVNRNVSTKSYKAKGFLKKNSFDIYKANEIFNHLLEGKVLKLLDGVDLPSIEELKGKKYYKWHNSWTHSTNQCAIFWDKIEDLIKRGKLRFLDKPMGVDEDPFPAV